MQTGGRGRLGRDWASPPGNLYMSGLIALRPGDPDAATLGLALGIALFEALSLWARPPAIKWPNDIMADGAKLAGLLLERRGEWIVAGFGANVAHHPDLPERPATSLAALGATIDVPTLGGLVAEQATLWTERWRGEGLAPIRREWLARAHPIGTALAAIAGNGERVHGLFDGLDADGALRLRLADGSARVIHAGDVFLI